MILSADSNRRFYVGLDNPVSVFINKCSCDKVKLEADQGRVEKAGGCHFIYRPDSAGVTHLMVSEKGNRKVKAVYAFRVYGLPNLDIQLGKYGGGTITKEALLQTDKLQYSLALGFVICDVPVSTDTFTFLILRDTSIVFAEKNYRNRITATEKEAIQKTEAGDRVLISNITAYINRKKYNLNPLEFTITN